MPNSYAAARFNLGIRQMSVWGRLAGAAAGLVGGGSIDREADGPPENEVAFTVGVIALGAKMAKADGVVTVDEVNAFKEVFKIPEGEMQNVARVFNLAKQDTTGYEAYADQLATMFKHNRKLLEDVLEGLFHIAKARGPASQRGGVSGPGRQALWYPRDGVQLHQGPPPDRGEA